MSNCCSSGSNSNFPSSSSMEQMATNYSLIWQEISAIQNAILSASSQCQVGGGQFSTTVGGNTPMTFISGISLVTVSDGGTGYYQDYPSVKFVPPVGSSGTGATATVTTNGGSIISINMVSEGSGYQPVSATMSVSSLVGTGALLQPLVDASGRIVSVNIINGGMGYTTSDTATATRAVAPNTSYVDAVFVISSVSITGQIVSVSILNSGSGYQPSVTTVELVSQLNPTVPYPTGTGFYATVFTNSTEIGTLGAITPGTLYTSGVYAAVPLIGGTGTGATANITVAGGSVTSVTMVSG